jgi:opacity protein-like surface antigen
MKLKKSLFFLIKNISFSLPLMAVLPPGFAEGPAAEEWTGPHVGVSIGAVLSKADISTNIGGITDTSYFSNSTDLNHIQNATNFSESRSTGTLAIQVGQDFSWGQKVLGVIFDFNGMRSDSSKSATGTYSGSANTYTTRSSLNLNWLATFRGRIGYSSYFHHWPSLTYLTAGPAFALMKAENSFSDTNSYLGAGGNQTSSYQLGWTAGIGLELKTTNHMSVDIEYLYVHLPSIENNSEISNSAPGFGVPTGSITNNFSSQSSLDLNLFNIRLNYRF